MKLLGDGRRMAMAPQLSVISMVAAHVKSLTRGSRTAMAHKLPILSEAAAQEESPTGARLMAVCGL